MCSTRALNAASAKLTAAGSQTTIKSPIDFSGLLPSNKQGWYFHGSLTTPPLSLLVNWFVFQTPITLDANQLAEYERVASSAGFLPTFGRPSPSNRASRARAGFDIRFREAEVD